MGKFLNYWVETGNNYFGKIPMGENMTNITNILYTI